VEDTKPSRRSRIVAIAITVTGIIFFASVLASAFAASLEDVADVADMVRTADNRRDVAVETPNTGKQPALEAVFDYERMRYVVAVSNDGALLPVIWIKVTRNPRVRIPRDSGWLEDQNLDGILDRGLDYFDYANYIRRFENWSRDDELWQAWYDKAVTALTVASREQKRRNRR